MPDTAERVLRAAAEVVGWLLNDRETLLLGTLVVAGAGLLLSSLHPEARVRLLAGLAATAVLGSGVALGALAVRATLPGA